ncbi:MAG: 2-oxoacid:acceptor oxidoreductase family protein [Candidatus Omnitrophota bacterium]
MKKNMLEIRWHGRGGQGAVTAAKIVADSCVVSGKFVQAFPEYGPERAGAPVKSFNRISSEPIFTHSQVRDPDVVLVLDPTLMDVVDVCEGLPEGGLLIVNTDREPAKVRSEFKIRDSVNLKTVDATGIAIKEFGKNIPNTPMIAALLRETDIVKLDDLIENFKKKYSRKFKPEVIDANIRSMRSAYEGVKS